MLIRIQMHFVLLITISLLFVREGHFWIILKKGRGWTPQSPPFCTCLIATQSTTMIQVWSLSLSLLNYNPETTTTWNPRDNPSSCRAQVIRNIAWQNNSFSLLLCLYKMRHLYVEFLKTINTGLLPVEWCVCVCISVCVSLQIHFMKPLRLASFS